MSLSKVSDIFGQSCACLLAYSSTATEVGSFISYAIFTVHLIRLFVKAFASNFSQCIQRPGNSSVIYGHFDFLPGGAARTGHSILLSDVLHSCLPLRDITYTLVGFGPDLCPPSRASH